MIKKDQPRLDNTNKNICNFQTTTNKCEQFYKMRWKNGKTEKQKKHEMKERKKEKKNAFFKLKVVLILRHSLG